MSENAFAKVAQATIRLIAFALVVISLLLGAEDLYRFYQFGGFSGGDVHLHDTYYVIVHVHYRASSLVLKAIPFLIGLILFWKSRVLAERLTRDLD